MSWHSTGAVGHPGQQKPRNSKDGFSKLGGSSKQKLWDIDKENSSNFSFFLEIDLVYFICLETLSVCSFGQKQHRQQAKTDKKTPKCYALRYSILSQLCWWLKANPHHLGCLFGTFWLPKHLSGTLVVSLTSACLDANDSTYHQNTWSEEMLVRAQNIICNSDCYMGDLQKFKTVLKKNRHSISQTLLVLRFEYDSMLDDPNRPGTRSHLHDHNSPCHIICHMTIWQYDKGLSVFTCSFFSCPEQILERDSACKGMEVKRINSWSETN